MQSGPENRKSPRRKVLKDGKIVIMNNWSLIDCCVRNLSDTGARLRCDDALSVPEEFRLLIPSDQWIRDAKVVWRRDGCVGVHFTGEARRAPPRKW